MIPTVIAPHQSYTLVGWGSWGFILLNNEVRIYTDFSPDLENLTSISLS
ncbi:hypothetical protein [Nostoc sp.]